MGKWIYLIDALDDYDKDKKKGAYNPFVLAYGAPTREELLKGKKKNSILWVARLIDWKKPEIPVLVAKKLTLVA